MLAIFRRDLPEICYNNLKNIYFSAIREPCWKLNFQKFIFLSPIIIFH